MKERVGAALSLDKFATAKVSKYDKRKLIEKQRALKAKQFNKYKKLKKRLEASSAPLNYTPYDPSQDDMQSRQHQDNISQHQHEQQHPAQKVDTQQALASRKHRRHCHAEQQDQQQQQQQQHRDGEDAGDEHKKSFKRPKQQKPPSQLQRLAEKAAVEKAAKEQERQQREQALAQRQQQVEQKKKQRGHQKHDFFKKTKHGQPVMKYRVDKILAVLEREKEGKS